MSTGIRFVEGCIQFFVVSLALFGWYLAVFEIGYGWLISHQDRWVAGRSYILCMSILAPTCIGLYVHLCSKRMTHNVFDHPVPDVTALSEPYTCATSTGELAVCNRGNCKSKWKPPRSHHCAVCGVCRLDFDHHCPWLGNCVTIQRRKAFLFLLTLFPITFAIGVAPIVQMVIWQIEGASWVSWNHALFREYWWDRPWSWIAIGGPPGRYIVGVILGYYALREYRANDRELDYGQLVAEPHLRVLSSLSILILLAAFAVLLAGWNLAEVLKGTTSYEALTRSGVTKGGRADEFICIPTARVDAGDNSKEQAMARIISVASLSGKQRLYDHGKKENWRRFWAAPLFPPESWTYTWPKLNPLVLQEVRHRLRSGSKTSV